MWDLDAAPQLIARDPRQPPLVSHQPKQKFRIPLGQMVTSGKCPDVVATVSVEGTRAGLTFSSSHWGSETCS